MLHAGFLFQRVTFPTDGLKELQAFYNNMPQARTGGRAHVCGGRVTHHRRVPTS
jgi:hypothetical protein